MQKIIEPLIITKDNQTYAIQGRTKIPLTGKSYAILNENYLFTNIESQLVKIIHWPNHITYNIAPGELEPFPDHEQTIVLSTKIGNYQLSEQETRLLLAGFPIQVLNKQINPKEKYPARLVLKFNPNIPQPNNTQGKIETIAKFWIKN